MVKPVLGPNPAKGVQILPGTALGSLVDSFEDLKKQSDRVLKVAVNNPLKYHRDGLSQLEAEQVKIIQNAIDSAGWSLTMFVFSVIYGSFLIGKAYILTLPSYNANASNPGFSEIIARRQLVVTGLFELANGALTYFNGYKVVARSLSGGHPTIAGLFETLLPLAAQAYVAYNDRTATNLVLRNKRDYIGFIDGLSTVVKIMMNVAQFYITFRKGQDERALQYLDNQMAVKNTQITQLVSHRGAVKDAFDSITNGLKRIVRNGFNTTADLAKNN